MGRLRRPMCFCEEVGGLIGIRVLGFGAKSSKPSRYSGLGFDVKVLEVWVLPVLGIRVRGFGAQPT